MNWNHILPFVEKPSRYLGTEVNAVRKDRQTCRLSFALAFPDTYEVGMSHLGLQILYDLLNRHPLVVAERCYAPWPDMEARMRQHGLPLSSLESHTALGAFDIVGFSLQYELSYTNVLNMLDMGGIPLHGKDRREGHPVVIAGGPCVFNPSPMTAFIDAFVIGEGEEAVMEIAETFIKGKEKNLKRREIIESLSSLDGLYVPSVHTGSQRIRKRLLRDMNLWRCPARPLVPLMNTIHDRIVIEIARGCTRGCRFCQAGMVWRPVRERSPEIVKDMAEDMLCATGHDELSLLSLSSGDYSMIEPLLADLMERYYARRVAIGLPSLRVETLKAGLIEEIKRVRKTSFTLAPEAGTQRLRNVINKGNTEADLLDTTGRVFDAGWKAVKLYFMLGLPGETEEDLAGIVDLAYKTVRTAANRGQVTVSLSTFVPKAHTPFQWQPQIGMDETRRRQDYLKKNIRHKHLNIKWHDSRMSLLEGIFSRGGEDAGPLIESAFKLGCRFDGWSDRFRFDLWEQAIRDTDRAPEEWLQPCNIQNALPWDRIDCGLDRDFLLSERDKSLEGSLTEDCRTGPCQNCGVCDHRLISPVTIGPAPRDDKTAIQAPAGKDTPSESPVIGRLLIRFAKKGLSRFLSHLEISAALIRAVNRSGLAFVYSQGFHPHPKISFAYATSVGMESEGEYAEIHVRKPFTDLDDLGKMISGLLPDGVDIRDIRELPSYAKSLSETLCGFGFEASLPEDMADHDRAALSRKIDVFMGVETFKIVREKKGKSTVKDIRPLVDSLLLEREKRLILMVVRFGPEGNVRPADILTQVLGIDGETAKSICIVKTDTIFRE